MALFGFKMTTTPADIKRMDFGNVERATHVPQEL